VKSAALSSITGWLLPIMNLEPPVRGAGNSFYSGGRSTNISIAWQAGRGGRWTWFIWLRLLLGATRTGTGLRRSTRLCEGCCKRLHTDSSVLATFSDEAAARSHRARRKQKLRPAPARQENAVKCVPGLNKLKGWSGLFRCWKRSRRPKVLPDAHFTLVKPQDRPKAHIKTAERWLQTRLD